MLFRSDYLPSELLVTYHEGVPLVLVSPSNVDEVEKYGSRVHAYTLTDDLKYVHAKVLEIKP